MGERRWVLECTWSGYRASQSHPCHREVITRRELAKRFEALHCVEFTDGTSMSVRIRPAMFRENVTPINGYYSLLRDALDRGSYVRVADLIAEREAKKEATHA